MLKSVEQQSTLKLLAMLERVMPIILQRPDPMELERLVR